MSGLTDNHAQMLRMQAGLRAWVARVTVGSVRGLRGNRLLALLCAAAVAPVFVTALPAAVIAGTGVLSSLGGGMLSILLSDFYARSRDSAGGGDDTSAGLAAEIGRVLDAGDANARALRADIAALLQEIDAGGTVLRAAWDEGNERVRDDVITVIGSLGAEFDELEFLVNDLARAAADIQQSLDAQHSDIRVVMDQNSQQSTEIRLISENVGALLRRVSARDGDGAAPRLDVAGSRWVHGCPYRGLLPFQESDAEVFYGRERVTAQLTAKIAGMSARGGLLIVTGASGAGKSSLLRAGLLPALARGQQVGGSQSWPRITITPTASPLTELATHLAALGGGDAATIRDGLRAHPGDAHLAVWSAVLADADRHGHDGSQSRLVLIVDQFEQVFTLHHPEPAGEDDRQAFISALRVAATTAVGPGRPAALVIIAVRGDFWDRCARYPELADALQDGQFVVGPMTESELRVAITGPADAAGLRIEPTLTETILGDLNAAGSENAAGVLPLLSQAMSLTWDKREGDQLTSHGYGLAGGVSHAIETSAEQVYDALPPADQGLARELLCAMTVASPDGRFTRRPATRAGLAAIHPDAGTARVDAVLEAFAAERLVVLDGASAQLSHDALLTAWPRLHGWLNEDRAGWILDGQLAADAQAWCDNGNDASFLYRGSQLAGVRAATERWAASPDRYPSLTGIKQAFLRASELVPRQATFALFSNTVRSRAFWGTALPSSAIQVVQVPLGRTPWARQQRS